MNIVQAALKQEIEQEISVRGGFDTYRAHALRHLQLRTVVRESHNTPVVQLAFNHAAIGNLVASVGGDQATVYDDVHIGDHVGVVVHFTNTRTEHHKGGALRAVAWVNCQGLTGHPGDDAWLAVSGCDHVVQVLSVAESRVVRQLTGHTCEVVDLSGARHAPGLLLSMSQDGSVRVWDVPAARCLASVATSAHTAELHGSATFFLTGHGSGEVCRWDLAPALTGTACQPAEGAGNGLQSEVLFTVSCDQPTVDCIRFIADDRVAVKTCGGTIGVWRLAGPQGQAGCRALWTTRVPGAATSGAYPSRCLMSACEDGAYLCCGNTSGSVHVYAGPSGQHVCAAAADKVEAPVRACGLSHDCRHLWAVLGNGFIFRFEYIAPNPHAAPERASAEPQEPTEQQQMAVAAVAAKVAAGVQEPQRQRQEQQQEQQQELPQADVVQQDKQQQHQLLQQQEQQEQEMQGNDLNDQQACVPQQQQHKRARAKPVHEDTADWTR